MATYVLVHGGGHGGWCYQRVARLLRAAGHEVHAPTLTGLGERSHLLSAAVDLDLHIDDVVAVLHFEDLRDVILVGHSYGGMVITGVADRAADRIGRIVYLDAATPVNGQSFVDVAGPIIEAVRPMGEVVDGVELVLLPAPDAGLLYGVTDPADLALDGGAAHGSSRGSASSSRCGSPTRTRCGRSRSTTSSARRPSRRAIAISSPKARADGPASGRSTPATTS